MGSNAEDDVIEKLFEEKGTPMFSSEVALTIQVHVEKQQARALGRGGSPRGMAAGAGPTPQPPYPTPLPPYPAPYFPDPSPPGRRRSRDPPPAAASQRKNPDYKPNDMLEKTRVYVERVKEFPDKGIVKAVRDRLQREFPDGSRLTAREIAVLGTLLPETPGDARAYHGRGLDRVDDGDLQDLLDEVIQLKNLS